MFVLLCCKLGMSRFCVETEYDLNFNSALVLNNHVGFLLLSNFDNLFSLALLTLRIYAGQRSLGFGNFSINTDVYEAAVDSGFENPSYWLDACEDVRSHLKDDFMDSGMDISTSLEEGIVGIGGFFGGIDNLLDNYNSINDVPSSYPYRNESSVAGNPSLLGESSLGDCGSNSFSGANDKVLQDELQRCCKREKSGDLPDEERIPKRSMHNSHGNERVRRMNVPSHQREGGRNRFSCRKRGRDWDQNDSNRDFREKNLRRCVRKDSCWEREWRDREPMGYWERDRLGGSSEIIFRTGKWEDEHSKEGKSGTPKIQECNAKVDDKPKELKEKIPEEHARQYQLDVLEQAKKKNTIAFMETGAGKTLIAVLLMKSVCMDLQKLNKKILAVFLVPKVPLVYQVTHSLTYHVKIHAFKYPKTY